MNNLQEFTLPNLSYQVTFPVQPAEGNIPDTLATVFATGYYSDSTGLSVNLSENMFVESFQITSNDYAFDVGFDIISRLQSTQVSFEDKKVLSYLKKRIHLVRLLNSAQKKLSSYFTDRKTRYFLRQTYSLDGIVLEIHTSQDGATALYTLEKFENEWWFKHMPVDSDKVLIDVVFA